MDIVKADPALKLELLFKEVLDEALHFLNQ